MRYTLIGDGARLIWYVRSGNGLESYRKATLKQYYWQINEGKCFLEIPVCVYSIYILKEIKIKENDVIEMIS